MFVIKCPWCGERAETEFSYGGEAGIVRPADGIRHGDTVQVAITDAIDDVSISLCAATGTCVPILVTETTDGRGVVEFTAVQRFEVQLDDGTVEGGPLSMAEMLSIIRQIQVAGSETTTSLLMDLMVLLEDRPEEWERIRTEPERANAVVEEALRISSQAGAGGRAAVEEAGVDGDRFVEAFVLHDPEPRRLRVAHGPHESHPRFADALMAASSPLPSSQSMGSVI